MYVGYIYNSDGLYDKKYYLTEDTETLSKFICMDMINDKTITDEGDNLVCKTIGNFLDRVPNQKLLGELQSKVIPYQTFTKKLVPLEFVETEPGIMVQKEIMDEVDAYMRGETVYDA